MKIELKGLCAVASILLATAVPCQNARSDVLDSVRNFLGPSDSGPYPYRSYGQPYRDSYDPYYGRDNGYRYRRGPRASAAQQQTAANLDQMSAQLTNSIGNARDSGRISNGQANELIRRVDGVDRQLNNTRTGDLSFAEAQDLTNELNSVNNRLQFYMNSGGRFRNPGYGGRWFYSGRNNPYYR